MSIYETIGIFDPQDVLPYSRIGCPSVKKFKIKNRVYSVKMNKRQYRLFDSNSTCVSCGIKGNLMLLKVGKYWKVKDYFFNLYAKDANCQLILMTQDHIVSRHKGGSNSVHNLQTMCEICNRIKGNSHRTPKEVNIIRKKKIIEKYMAKRVD